MTLTVKHPFQSAKGDGLDTTLVQPSNWNASHDLEMATGAVLGRATAGSGVVEEITYSALATLMLAAIEAALELGSLASLNSVLTAYITDANVTNAKLANVATATIKGRATAGPGAPEDLTAAQAAAVLPAVVGDTGTGGTKGLVPAPAAGDAAARKVLGAGGAWTAPGIGPDLIFEHQAASGTSGGSINSNTDTTSPITNLVYDRLGIGALAGNQMQITAVGTYYFEWGVKGDRIAGFQSWLHDITGGAVVKDGSSEACNPASDASAYSTGQAYVTITASNKWELRIRCANGQGTFGLGQSAGVGHTEIYAYAKIWKTG